MKNLLTIFCLLMTTAFQSNAQKTYEILSDSAHDNTKMLRGIISKEDINRDPVFDWYAESQRIYPHPDTAAVAAFRNNKDKIYFIVFGGTWCEDTHFVLPKFFKIQEASNFPENRIALFAVDRFKHTTGNIAQALHVTNVPTIIVMKDGREIGRVVEYGKNGKWDKDLAEIIDK
ncbi:MAG: thioredoxin family protein [Bacteroidota bacterium]|nr:thioredoxin family protein [Bacteroidota bacterium]